MTRAAALASGTPVALETNGTVRDARGLASRTYRTSRHERELDVEQAAHADAARRSPRWSAGSARARSAPSVTGGSTQAESPEWMPASSMCSMTPPRNISSPSNSASTSISIASSRNRSMSTGCSRC